MTEHTRKPPSGLPMALGAYIMWGLLPLYLRLVDQVPPFEFVGWRVVFTLPVCLVIIALRRQWRDLSAAIISSRVMGTLLASSLLIGGNWLIYVHAIQAGHIFASSLGYYINPLGNVLLGTLFLGERLSRRQWSAVALAAAGVGLLAWGARDTLWISLSLAATFACYGLVRKVVAVGSLPGLTVESAILMLPALVLLASYGASPAGTSFGQDAATSLLIAASGLFTAAPLLLFAVAARRMDYSTLGFIQYLAPTIVFFQGLFIFREPLRPMQLACFIAIWAAIALFSWDLWLKRKG